MSTFEIPEEETEKNITQEDLEKLAKEAEEEEEKKRKKKENTEEDEARIPPEDVLKGGERVIKEALEKIREKEERK